MWLKNRVFTRNLNTNNIHIGNQWIVISMLMITALVLTSVFYFIAQKSLVSPGKARLVERTPQSTTHKINKDTYSTRLYPTAKWYKDSKGKWQDINTSLKVSGDGSQLRTVPNKLPYKVSFSKNVTKPLTFSIGKANVSFSPAVNGQRSTVNVSKNKATYYNIYKNTNLERIITPQGLKQNYILTKPGHPNYFTENIDSNLTVKLEKDGSLSYMEGSRKLATSPKPHLTDAGGKTIALRYVLSRDKLRIALPSLKGLSYPVTLDPSIYGDNSGGDLVVDGMEYTITGDRQGANGYNSITVQNGGTLIIQPNDTVDGSVIDVTNNVLVTGNSQIVTKGYNTTGSDGKGVNVNAVNVQVDAGSKITADNQGYGGGLGSGAGQNSVNHESAGGAGYGGQGGRSINGWLGGSIYGSLNEPLDLGSGGGDVLGYFWESGKIASGASGGGSVKITTSSALILNGTISSNGASVGGCYAESPGGGSGGSVLLDVGSLTGTGAIKVEGGSSVVNPSCPQGGYGGGGAGGRATIYYGDRITWAGTIVRNGGGSVYSGGAGSSGTLLLRSKNLPANPSAKQTKLDGSSIKAGGITDETGIQFNLSFWAFDEEYNNLLSEIELKPINQAFNGANTTFGDIILPASASPVFNNLDQNLYILTANLPLGSLSNNVAYHWRARIKNYSTGKSSSWLTFGDNSDGDPNNGVKADSDFIVKTQAQAINPYDETIRAPYFLNVGLKPNGSTGKEVNINWLEPFVGTVDHYNIYRSNYTINDINKDGAMLIAKTASTDFIDADKTKVIGRTYYYQVTAVDVNGVESVLSTQSINEKVTLPSEKVTWTTKEDFESNALTTGNPTINNGVNLTALPGDVMIAGPAEYGTGADGDLVVDGSTAASSTDGQIHNASNPLVLDGEYNFVNLTLQNGAVVTHTGTNIEGMKLKITGKLTIDSLSKIDVSAKGYLGGDECIGRAGQGPGGAPWTSPGYGGGGGGYGGAGGAGGKYDPANPSSGQGGLALPLDVPSLGSGGAGTYGISCDGTAYTGKGGNGGGSVKIQAKIIGLSGSIIADGQGGSWGYYGEYGGGGSGGGIFIESNSSFDASQVYARGGDGGYWLSTQSGGGGGGGRITVMSPGVTGTPTVTGGKGYKLSYDGVFSYTVKDVGQYLGTLTGLQFTANANVDWQRIEWHAEPLKADQNIAFQIRMADTLAGLQDATFVGYDGTLNSWFDSANKDIPNVIEDRKYIEIMAKLSTTSESPVLHDISIAYVLVNEELVQLKTSGGNPELPVGGALTQDKIMLQTRGIKTPVDSTQARAQFEVKSVSESFDGLNLVDGSITTTNINNSTSSATVENLASPVSYHWRARVIDDKNRVGDWIQFGANSEGNPPAIAADTDFLTGFASVLPSQPGIPSSATPTINTKPTWYWQPAGGGIGGIKGYNVFIGTAPGATDIVNGAFTANTFFKHQTVLSQGTYFAYVVAVDNASNLSLSSPIGQVEVLTDASLTAMTPAFLNVSEQPYPGRAADLNWQAAPLANVDYYKVYRGGAAITDANLGSAELVATQIKNTTYTDNTVERGRTYYYQVTAVNIWGSESKISVNPINDKATIPDQSAFLWTNKDDFENNASTTNNTTSRTNIDTQSFDGDIRLTEAGGLAVDTGSGTDGDYALSSSKTIKDIYETDLGYGAGSYDPATGAVPNFNNLTITPTGQLTTTDLVPLELKVKNTLSIETGGRIDAIGRGYSGGLSRNSLYCPYSGINDGGYAIAGSGPGGGGPASWYFCNPSGGGGGGYGGAGGSGSGAGAGSGGLGYGAYPATPTFGSGGGGGVEDLIGSGASGGGLIKISANSININGNILNNGANGLGGGGGGSGGGIYILSKTPVNASNVFSKGGQGGPGVWWDFASVWRGGAGGGAGGRINVVAPAVVAPGAGNYSGSSNGSAGAFTADITPVFNASGSIGGDNAGEIGLQAKVDRRVRWTALNLNVEPLASENIKMQIRTADTETDLANATYVGYDGTAATFFDKDNLQIPASIAASKYAEIKLLLTSDGLTTPIIHSISLEYEKVPVPDAASLSQHKTNDQAIAVGDSTDETQIKLRVSNVIDNLKAQFEVKPINEAFNGQILVGGALAAGGVSQATIDSLVPAKAYHWRARLVDGAGAESDWSSFGNNLDGQSPDIKAQADFSVDSNLDQPRNLDVQVPPPPEKVANLIWTAPPSGSVNHYNIYRYNQEITALNQAQAEIIADNVTSTSYSDITVYPGDTYYYQVTAVDNSNAESGLSIFVKNSKAYIQNKADAGGSDVSPHRGSGYTTLGSFCRNCHNVHNAKAPKKLFRKVGEEVCFTCHDGTGSSFNIMVTFKDKAAHDKQWTSPEDTGVKCTNCHHPHGATNYLGKDSGERMTKRVEEKLCLGCHDKPISVSNWNIKEMFERKSRHAITGETGDGLKGAKVECSSCHNPHVAERGVGFTDVRRLVDPTNTFKQWQGSLRDFCLKCHQSTDNTPKKKATASEFVPYTIEFPDVSTILSPYFPGWDKSAFRDSGHYQKGLQCNKCHMPHGSPNQRLNALYVGDGQLFQWPKPDNITEVYPLSSLTGQSGQDVSIGNFGRDYGGSYSRVVLRFKIAIPNGSTIKSAVIKDIVPWPSPLGDNSQLLTIFTAGIRLMDGEVTNPEASTTPELINWPLGPWFVGSTYSTTDITTLIQDYINRPELEVGNMYVGIRFDEGDATNGENRVFTSAQLEVNYNAPTKTVPNPIADEGAYDFRAREETLCFQCHRPDNPLGAPDILTPFTIAGGSSHFRIWEEGKHKDTENNTDLSAPNRHSECFDCHDPHKVKPGKHQLATNNLASGPINGMKGVGVINGPAGTDPILYPLDKITYEYELCFKCHSKSVSGGLGSERPTEFNPNNASFHPIQGVGKNLGIKDEAFKEGTPWNPNPDVWREDGVKVSGDDPDYGLTGNVEDPNSVPDPNYANGTRVTCTDCHGNSDPAGAQGPHGSANQRILKKPVPEVCFQCHNQKTYTEEGAKGSRFWAHPVPNSPHVTFLCTNCHTIHGSGSKPHLLAGTSLPTVNHDENEITYCNPACHGGSGAWGGMNYRHRYRHISP